MQRQVLGQERDVDVVDRPRAAAGEAPHLAEPKVLGDDDVSAREELAESVRGPLHDLERRRHLGCVIRDHERDLMTPPRELGGEVEVANPRPGHLGPDPLPRDDEDALHSGTGARRSTCASSSRRCTRSA